MPTLFDNCCTCGSCELFAVDAGHVLKGFLPLPVWARGSYSVDPSGDVTTMNYAVETFFGETSGMCLGRYERGDLDAANTPSVPYYLTHSGVQADVNITHRYLTIRYEASGYNVSGTGAVDNPWVFEAWSRYSEATVEKHSGLIVSLEMGVTVGVTTTTYTKTLNTTTGAYTETGSFDDVCNANTTFDSWTAVVASGFGGASANVAETQADLEYYVTQDAYPGTGQPAGNTYWRSNVIMDPDTLFTLEDALAEADALLDLVDHTRAGDGSYQLTINGSTQDVKLNTKLIVGWSGWPLAARIQSVDYPPVSGTSITPVSQDDRRIYPARRTLNWSFPNIATEDVWSQTLINEALDAESLPTFFFNSLNGDDWQANELGVRLTKGCVTSGSDRVCAHTENQEPPIARTTWITEADNGALWSYDDDIEDCVRDFLPGDKICVDPADIIFAWGRLRLLRRCFSHTTDPPCCDMENP